MLSHRILPATLLASSLLALGCLGDAGDLESTQDWDVPVETLGGGLEGYNGLDPDCLWDYNTLYPLFLLGQGPLRGADGFLVPTDLLLSACGERVLSYTLACALPADERIELSTGGAFGGNYGLAHKWLEAPLDPDQKRWITACVIQHLNGLGFTVPLMLDGDHEALEPEPGADTSAYIIPEATMFGSFFSDAPTLLTPPPVFACSEDAVADACGPLTSPFLEQRICGSSSYCGLTYLGRCSKACSTGNDKFWVCDDGDGTVYTQTLRSYLTTGGANSQYEICADF